MVTSNWLTIQEFLFFTLLHWWKKKTFYTYIRYQANVKLVQTLSSRGQNVGRLSACVEKKSLDGVSTLKFNVEYTSLYVCEKKKKKMETSCLPTAVQYTSDYSVLIHCRFFFRSPRVWQLVPIFLLSHMTKALVNQSYIHIYPARSYVECARGLNVSVARFRTCGISNFLQIFCNHHQRMHVK